MVLPVLAGVLGGIGTALIGSRASSNAAEAQTDAANAQIDSNERIFNMQRADLAGYRDAGANALNALNIELGLGPVQQEQQPQTSSRFLNNLISGGTETPASTYQPYESDGAYDAIYGTGPYEQDTSYDQIFGTGPYEQSDRYQFLQDASQRAIDSSAAGQGNLFSSATIADQQNNAFGLAAQDYSTWQAGQQQRVAYNDADYANWQTGQERRVGYDTDQYNNYLNRLTGLTGIGQSAAAMQANAAGNLGQANATALANSGDAQSAGIIGGYNALSNGIQNGLGTYGYLSQTGAGTGTGGITIGGNNSLFGNSWT